MADFSPGPAIPCPRRAAGLRTVPLRLSILNQILIPLLAIQGVTVCAITDRGK